jgi:D-alanyl-D-alanine carboxypeptidase/D-alanyl-D-alanine-endopeptidase (penicillin-binding protein 4)
MLRLNIKLIHRLRATMYSLLTRALPVEQQETLLYKTCAMLVGALVLVAATSAGSSSTMSPPVNGQLEAIIKRELPANCSLTLQVVDLESGRVILEKNPDLPLIPASTMKVVTSAAALQVLHPDFTFVTEVLADSVRNESVGNLYVRGGGDPYLVNEELFALTRALKDKGLQEIRGSIVVDDSYFAPEPPLDENEKLGLRSYHAPYSALSLNFNSIKTLVQPASRSGQPANIIIDPISEYSIVEANVKTVKGSAPEDVKITKRLAPGGREVIRLDGTIGAQAPGWRRYVNVALPSLYFGEVFKEFLLREGVRVTGKVVRGKVPSAAVSYHEFNSRPLGGIVYWLNKLSNNFMAEQISMAMGAHVHGAPGTREKGLAVIRKHLLSCGVSEECFSLSEASGLSRNNRLSASALVRVLLQASRDFTYNAEYMASFGVAGVDGTLKEKFTDATIKRRMRAKTGTLKGVNALAGYGISPSGKSFVLAIIVNNLEKGTGLIDFGDRIVRAIMDLPALGR